MKTVSEVYGFTKTAFVAATGRGIRGFMGLVGERLTRPIVNKTVDFGSRAGKKFMEGGIGDKLTIGLGGLTTAYVGLKGLDAATGLVTPYGTRTANILPQEGLLYDFGNPFHGQGYDYKKRAKKLIRNANLQPAYMDKKSAAILFHSKLNTPENVRG